jgi:ribosome biogenesis protein SSF1/2
MAVSKSNDNTNLRIGRLPKGPTLSFRVEKYCLMKDITQALKNARSPGSEYLQPPLLVLNNFNREGNEFKLMTTILQNMFPALNVNSVEKVKRVVLFNYDQETKRIEFRHYFIDLKMAGVSKSVKRIMQADLSKYADVSEFILQDAGLSESEAEDNGESTVTSRATQKRIRLQEIGPRMTLRLIKIQQELCGGEVLYHDYVKKTDEEKKALKADIQKKKQEKQRRREEQEKNVERKRKREEESDDSENDDEDVASDAEDEFEDVSDVESGVGSDSEQE